MIEACAKLYAGKAPGPDNIVGSIIISAIDRFVSLWAQCFLVYMRKECFLKAWKTAKLILLKKPNKPDFRFTDNLPLERTREAF